MVLYDVIHIESNQGMRNMISRSCWEQHIKYADMRSLEDLSNHLESMPANLYILSETLLLKNDSLKEEGLASKAVEIIRQSNPGARILLLGRNNLALSEELDTSYLDMSDLHQIMPLIKELTK